LAEVDDMSAAAELIERASGEMDEAFRHQEQLRRAVGAVADRLSNVMHERATDQEMVVWGGLAEELLEIKARAGDTLEGREFEDWVMRAYKLVLFERNPHRSDIRIPATQEEWDQLPDTEETLERLRRASG
jgi:hypothetical protein